MQKTLKEYDFFTDFTKVNKNLDFSISFIKDLESLKKSKSIEDDLLKLLNNKPDFLKFIFLLLAKRIDKKEMNQYFLINNEIINFNLDIFEINKINLYRDFLKKSGIIKLINEKIDFYSYIKGIEVGLDSNARKNRSGTLFQDLIEKYLQENNFDYIREATNISINRKLKLNYNDLYSEFNLIPKEKAKRYDFAYFKNNKLYLVECNYYSSSGSKLNETSRSYIELNKNFKNKQNIKFVWLTDGIGWNSTKNSLKAAYAEIEHLYNLNDVYKNRVLLKI